MTVSAAIVVPRVALFARDEIGKAFSMCGGRVVVKMGWWSKLTDRDVVARPEMPGVAV